MEVFPQNVNERMYAVINLTFAMVVFASFVSSCTAGMTRLRNLQAESLEQGLMLRRFLTENNVSPGLACRVTRYIDIARFVHKRRVQRNQVKRLCWLSGPLNIELSREVAAPYLTVHHTFKRYAKTNDCAMNQLCFTAITTLSLSKSDALFHCYLEAEHMFFLTTGTLYYRRASILKCGQLTTNVERNGWCVEAVLWMPWNHHGTMRALTECDVMTLSSKQFRNVTVQYPHTLREAARYAQIFLEELLVAINSYGSGWDLPICMMEETDTSELKGDISTMVTEAETIEAELRANLAAGEGEGEGVGELATTKALKAP